MEMQPDGFRWKMHHIIVLVFSEKKIKQVCSYFYLFYDPAWLINIKSCNNTVFLYTLQLQEEESKLKVLHLTVHQNSDITTSYHI